MVSRDTARLLACLSATGWSNRGYGGVVIGRAISYNVLQGEARRRPSPTKPGSKESRDARDRIRHGI